MNTKLGRLAILMGLIGACGCGGGTGSPEVQSPFISEFNPPSVVVGDQVNVQIKGNNFQQFASCTFGQGITVNLCEFLNASLLVAHLTIATTAALGARTVTIRNPDGKSASNNGFTVVPPLSTNLILNIGDAPVENLLSFSVTIERVEMESFSLIFATKRFTALSSPRRVEISRLGGTAVPFAVVTGPTDLGFCTMRLTFSSPEVSFLDSSGVVQHPLATLVSDTARVDNCSLDPPINVTGLILSNIPTVVTFDFDVSGSLSTDGSGTINVNPILGRRVAVVGSAAGQQYWSGAIENLAGIVTNTTANAFAVRTSQTGFSFLVGANTSFVGLDGIGALKKGMIVQVEANTGSDGQFTAKKVTLEEGSLHGQESRGIVISSSGTPATKLTLVEQESLAPGVTLPSNGSSLEVTLAGATFEMESEHVDLTNLSFNPSFDANTIFAGQSVIVDTDQPSVSSLAARKIQLSEQALRGSVSDMVTNGGQTVFTLTLDSGSAFTALTGATFLQVIQQPSTLETVDVSSAPSVIVRGLLFKTETGYELVANTIGP